MERSERAPLLAFLVMIGLCWGLTIPLGKIAVSGGYRHVGIIFWQFAIGALVLFVLNALRGKGLPRDRASLVFYTIIALIGTLLPNSASYTAAVHLPAGILGIVIAMVPMLAFPIALAWGTDRFSMQRLLGLCLGMVAIVLIAAPQTSLPDRSMAIWVLVALISPAFYAFEGNFVAVCKPEKLDAVQVLLGASLIGTVITLPLAVLSGEWINPLPPYGIADMAVALSAVLHALTYTGYVWLVGRSGAVFAAQVSYLVTGFAILWSGVLLGERYSLWVWAAFGIMLLGLFLVQPRPKDALATKGLAGP